MTDKNICESCDTRIPRHRPILSCSLCQKPRHYKCNNLSRKDAEEIIANPTSHRSWICQICYKDVFPEITTELTNNPEKKQCIRKDIMQICHVCNKKCSMKTKNFITCQWCDLPCHTKKCYRSSLGCLNCCLEHIPGYLYEGHHFSNDFLAERIKLFNPYELDSIFNQIGDDSENESESMYLNELSNVLNRCSYKEPTNVPNTQYNELRILYLNVRSLSRHIDECRDNFSYSEQYDVLCFNETNCDTEQLPDGIENILIEGFHEPILQKPIRSSNRGGGLATYVNLNVCAAENFEKFVIPEDAMPAGPAPCESLFVKLNIELERKNTYKSYLVGNIYRSPSNNASTLHDYLESLLSSLDRHGNKNITYGGDFNIDLCKYELDNNSQALIDSATRHNFVQLINRPTRITQHSATLIDHIYTNKVCDVVSTGVVTYDISDHLGTYVTIALREHRGSIDYDYAKTAEANKINEENLAKFKDLLRNESWDIVHDTPGAQGKYDKFIEIYQKHYDAAFPKTRPKRKNERKNPKPWILPWLEDACARKNKLYIDFVKKPTEVEKVRYDKLDKFCRKHVDLAKQKYYTNFFNKYSDCSKKQWQMINGLMNRSKAKRAKIKLKDHNGNLVNNPKSVAENFNEYFTTIADKLKAQIQTDQLSTQDYRDTLTDEISGSIFLHPTHPLEIDKTISSLKLKSTSDINISTIKAAAETPRFKETLSEVINMSFADGVFPNQLKTARVVPIHKGGSKTEVSNYRPISLLPAFSKIFEKLMHSRVYDFLEQNKSLYDMQFGFRPRRSCEHALLVAKNEILSALNKKQTALLLLVDYSKAFDLVDHDILLHKLWHYGIRGKAHDWFRSYLSNRRQFVSIEDKISNTNGIRYGVPQGSVLGPLLFILYINDLPNISDKVRFILYADDANIVITAETEAEIISIYENFCGDLVKWVNVNGLFLNIKKTHYMIFTRRRHSLLNSYEPYVGDTMIDRKKVARFLGVLLDEKLTWSYHITAIKAKMSRYIGSLYKLKKILPLKARLLLFNSLVQSHLNYCSLIWGLTNKCKIEQLFSTQKKAIRAIMPGYVKYFYKDGEIPTHTKTFYNEHEILTVHSIIMKNILIFMNKIHNFPQLLPKSVLDTVTKEPLTPSQNSYLSEWYQTHNTPTYRMTTYFKGPILFNDFINNPDNYWITLDNLNRFKINVKTYLIRDVQCASKTENLNLNDADVEWLPENFPLYQMTGLRSSARLNHRALAH